MSAASPLELGDEGYLSAQNRPFFLGPADDVGRGLGWPFTPIGGGLRGPGARREVKRTDARGVLTSTREEGAWR